MNEEARAPNYELAENDYISGMKYKEIAEKYNVTINTVKSWKQRYDWSKDKKKSVHTKGKKSMQEKKYAVPIADEVKHVMENTELTDEQKLFCLNYVKCFNATKAYQKAYECSRETAMTNGSRLLRNARVKEEIQSLKQNRLNRELLSTDDIVQRYIDIAFADITDYADFGTREVTFSNNEGMEATTEMSYVDAKPAWMVDGTLLSEVSIGKGGIKIKLLDQMKALQWISDHMDLLTPEQQARINHMHNKDKLERERFNHQKELDERSNF